MEIADVLLNQGEEHAEDILFGGKKILLKIFMFNYKSRIRRKIH